MLTAFPNADNGKVVSTADPGWRYDRNRRICRHWIRRGNRYRSRAAIERLAIKSLDDVETIRQMIEATLAPLKSKCLG
ncbi:MAG: hypothetical protein ACXW14_05590 [Burkholderiaceae bacterium]